MNKLEIHSDADGEFVEDERLAPLRRRIRVGRDYLFHQPFRHHLGTPENLSYIYLGGQANKVWFACYCGKRQEVRQWYEKDTFWENESVRRILSKKLSRCYHLEIEILGLEGSHDDFLIRVFQELRAARPQELVYLIHIRAKYTGVGLRTVADGLVHARGIYLSVGVDYSPPVLEESDLEYFFRKVRENSGHLEYIYWDGERRWELDEHMVPNV